MEERFSPEELRLLKSLDRPAKIQAFLDNEVRYHHETSCRSPRRVMRDRFAHCAEGALFAAAALTVNGVPPLIVDLEAVRDDDHFLAVFRDHGRWGAIAKSNFAGLQFREPVYRTLRELVMSYYEHYFNTAGEKNAANVLSPDQPAPLRSHQLDDLRRGCLGNLRVRLHDPPYARAHSRDRTPPPPSRRTSL